MKQVKLFFGVLQLAILIACTPMDDRYSDLAGDGPITYIAKLNVDSVQVNGGRMRVEISLPASDDPRAKEALITWANKTRSLEVDISQTDRTRFMIPDLTEGSYIFDITLLDDLGNSSLTISKTGNVYGDSYEKYLINRILRSFSLTDGQATLTFADIFDQTIVGSEVKWSQSGNEKTLFVDSTRNQVIIENFQSLSFQYRAVYHPEAAAVDSFYSPINVYALNTSVLEMKKEKEGEIEITFAQVSDDHYAGVDISWVQEDGQEFSYRADKEENPVLLTDFYAKRFSYRAVFRYEDQEYYSEQAEYDVLVPVDLDRTGWQVTVSHPLPTDAAISNAPKSLIDGNATTCLSLLKPGKSSGGITVGINEKVFFIIDMGSIQPVDYFRILHRDNGATGLRAQAYSFYGSYNGSDFSVIKEGISVDVNQLTVMEDLPLSNYRYIKVTYDQWSSSNNTMQIAELNLGSRK